MNNYDIDFVVIWVDGNDPQWQREKEKYSSEILNDSNNVNRFRDWNLMKYWFRAVEKYTPWVRKIHFVTYGHLPNFLNLENNKLNIVKHGDIIPDNFLPTFNSCALELNIHRIEGLADRFVYFNDDMFINRPLESSYFFSKDGMPCQYYAEIPTQYIGLPTAFDMEKANDMGIINKHFSKMLTYKEYGNLYKSKEYLLKDNVRSEIIKLINPRHWTGFKNFHCPAPFLKSTYETIWESENDILLETTSHKFRNKEDVNQYLPLWWQLASGKFSPKRINNHLIGINESSIGIIEQEILEGISATICINDVDVDCDFDCLSSHIRKVYEIKFPNKSSFEK